MHAVSLMREAVASLRGALAEDVEVTLDGEMVKIPVSGEWVRRRWWSRTPISALCILRL